MCINGERLLKAFEAQCTIALQLEVFFIIMSFSEQKEIIYIVKVAQLTNSQKVCFSPKKQHFHPKNTVFGPFLTELGGNPPPHPAQQLILAICRAWI